MKEKGANSPEPLKEKWHVQAKNWKDLYAKKQKLMPPSHTWMVFHTNPCKLQNFQTAFKHLLKHYGAQISF